MDNNTDKELARIRRILTLVVVAVVVAGLGLAVMVTKANAEARADRFTSCVYSERGYC